MQIIYWLLMQSLLPNCRTSQKDVSMEAVYVHSPLKLAYEIFFNVACACNSFRNWCMLQFHWVHMENYGILLVFDWTSFCWETQWCHWLHQSVQAVLSRLSTSKFDCTFQGWWWWRWRWSSKRNSCHHFIFYSKKWFCRSSKTPVLSRTPLRTCW